MTALTWSHRMKDRVLEAIYNWQKRYHPNKRQHYILPTTYGYLFGLVLLVMLIASVNYQRNLGYLLTFLLASVGLLCMIYTYRNLAQITLKLGKVAPIFAGHELVIPITLHSGQRGPHYCLHLEWRGKAEGMSHVFPEQNNKIVMRTVLEQRGLYFVDRILVSSTFPLGLFYCWTWFEVNRNCLVYPKPKKKAPVFVASAQDQGNEHGHQEEELNGLRRYIPGDAPRHIAWRVLAQEKGLYSKAFVSHSALDCWLEWENCPASSVEEKLALLCYWILCADAAQALYGLKIPGLVTALDTGERHKHACLTALALYGDAKR